MSRPTSRPSTRPTYVLLAGLALTAATSASAHAATAKRTDPAGDVVTYDSSGVPVTAPNLRNGDIVSRTYTHTTTAVQVRVAYRDLAKAGSQLTLSGQIVTSSGAKRVFQAFATPDYWPGSHYLTNAKGMPVTCSGMRHSFDYTHDVATVSIPRGCLGKPSWVRVGVQHSWFDQAGVMSADDAGRAGWSESADVVLSGRIAKG
jgi:hypothetical protein